MRPGHFEALRPICPVCRSARRIQSFLTITRVLREEPGHIIEGLLQCPDPACLREYPIIDGIPLLVADIRGYVSGNLPAIQAREDLSEVTESVLADCAGPGSAYLTTQEHLSIYAWDHYGDLDPEPDPAGDKPGSVRAVLAEALELAGDLPPGPILDAGCSVGRTSFEMAAHGGEMVLGVDLHYAMLRVASNVLRRGEVRYPKKRVGLVFDRRSYPVDLPAMENVDFWACDAAALPFAPGTFANAVSLNLLDCVHSPRDFLVSLAGVLRTGGAALISTPYDWSAAATPLEAWLGGHSQRGPNAGASEPVLRSLLTPGAHPAGVPGLVLESDRTALPWRVRVHSRSTMQYQVHLVVARAT